MTQPSFAVAAKLISTFVFATRIVQFLYFPNPNFQASSHLQWIYSPVRIGPKTSFLMTWLILGGYKDKSWNNLLLHIRKHRRRSAALPGMLLSAFLFRCSDSIVIFFYIQNIYTMHNKFSNCFVCVRPSKSELKFHLLA